MLQMMLSDWTRRCRRCQRCSCHVRRGDTSSRRSRLSSFTTPAHCSVRKLSRYVEQRVQSHINHRETWFLYVIYFCVRCVKPDVAVRYIMVSATMRGILTLSWSERPNQPESLLWPPEYAQVQSTPQNSVGK